MQGGGPIRGGRRAACLAAALLALGCHTTAPEETTRAPAVLLSATEFAGKLHLDRHALDDTGRMALTNSAGVAEIVLFPETTVVSVRGVQYNAASTIDLRNDEAWLTKDDASAIEMMWQSTPIPSSGWHEPLVRPLGTGPAPQTGATAPPPTTVFPRGLYADQPTDAERRAWGVPLKIKWQYIVIHHSASDTGSAREFDVFHKSKGWDGLAYDFVIDNGSGGPDGRVEVGYRWLEQKRGAHAGVDLFNEVGIGICLVGDFTRKPPTAAQIRSLARLTNFLSAYCGIPRENFRRHGDLKKTTCPGPLFPQDFFAAPLRAVAGTK